MIRSAIALTLVLSLALAAAQAHFVFVVPEKDGKSISVVFSDDLSPDEKVSIDKIAGLKLTGRFGDGKSAPVEWKKAEHSLTATLGTSEPRVVYGTIDYGVLAKGDTKPYLLKYHPKAVFAGATEKQATIGDAPLEIVPVLGAKPIFRVLAAGKPAAEVEVNVIGPDGNKKKHTTDKDGATPTIEGTGRFGAYAKWNETKKGELDGKAYEEVRHYATLVVDVATK